MQKVKKLIQLSKIYLIDMKNSAALHSVGAVDYCLFCFFILLLYTFTEIRKAIIFGNVIVYFMIFTDIKNQTECS